MNWKKNQRKFVSKLGGFLVFLGFFSILIPHPSMEKWNRHVKKISFSFWKQLEFISPFLTGKYGMVGERIGRARNPKLRLNF